MKKYLKYILALTLSTAAFTSCQRDLLNPVPQTSISDVSAFDTPARVSGQVLALYAALKNGLFYGGRYVVYGDIRGEDLINITTNLVTNSDVWSLNPTNTANAVVGLWAQAYATINACNIFIDGMAAKGTSVVGNNLSNNYLAEAKLIRALSYYSLLQYYALPYAVGNGSKPGLPLRLTGIKGPGASDLARSSVADVYTQVISDLDYAESNLPLTYGNAYNNTTRAHRNTAIALKTRVYLSMQKYDKVVSEANKIVPATPPFTASTGVANNLQADPTTPFKSYTTAESILSMPMTTSASPLDYPGTQNGLAYYYYTQGSPGSAEFYLNPAGIVGDASWKLTDKRRNLIYTNSSGRQFIAKYTTGSPYTDYVPVIRYAEVLLNLAEAKVRLNNTVDQQAIDILNAIRGRADATTVFTLASFVTPADLINAILKERRIEFLGEGLRNNDLMRLLQNIPAKGSAPSKTPSDAGYIWPISNVELSLNHLMTDN